MTITLLSISVAFSAFRVLHVLPYCYPSQQPCKVSQHNYPSIAYVWAEAEREPFVSGQVWLGLSVQQTLASCCMTPSSLSFLVILSSIRKQTLSLSGEIPLMRMFCNLFFIVKVAECERG